MIQFDFAGRCAVVTGGVQGIGAAIAKRLQTSGAKVAIWDLDGKPRVDVADQASIDAAVKRTIAELGSIDVLINNAGIAGPSLPVVDYPVGEWKRDRKSTRLNSSHVAISYAVFCLKKKKEKIGQ